MLRSLSSRSLLFRSFRLLLFATSMGMLAHAAPAQISPQNVTDCSMNQPAPQLPLHTSGRYIVDQQNRRVKLASVAWYGGESVDFVPGGLQLEPLLSIAHRIRCMGFNSVRLPWSNQMVESNPIVPGYAIAANPEFQGMHAMDVFDIIVRTLAANGLLVILDNHNSNAEWCCGDDGNELWYNADYPQSSWLADWQGMVARYRDVPQVIGADLRNEPRITATWGGAASTDWHAAAELGGNAVLGVNPNLLIIVEGVNYALDLTGVASLPVALNVPNRLVYSAHDYSFDHNGLTSAAELASDLNSAWGYIVAPGQSYTAPVWVGEFGNCHTSATCITDTNPSDGSGGFWFAALRQYLAANDIDWDWWALNGTETTGSGRTFGSEETYGLLNPYWNSPATTNDLPASPLNVLGALDTIAQPSQGPGVSAAQPPLVALTMPLPGSTVVAGSSLAVSADATLEANSSDSISQVNFFANGRPIGSATASPWSIAWQNIAPGTYFLQAQAITSDGMAVTSQPVTAQSINYLASAPAYTDAIGINFVSYAVTPMAPTEVAGAVPLANWNQAGVANSGTMDALVDENGAATSASVTWNAPNTYSIPISDNPGNDRMMAGYLDNSNTVPNTVEVAGLPPGFAHYDVYVYFDGDNGSATRVANYRITSVGAFGLVHGCAGQMEEGSTITGTDAASEYFAGTFAQASGGSPGNYVVFRGCSGSSFSLAPIHANSSDSQVRAPVNGIQILAY
jgi:endoglucanase